MKTVTGTVRSFSFDVANQVIKPEVEKVAEAQASMTSKNGGIDHTISVRVPDDKIDAVVSIFKRWKWDCNQSV
jgi:metal-dependent amidase/aminoacylase/carboxypeptidase family protein